MLHRLLRLSLLALLAVSSGCATDAHLREGLTPAKSDNYVLLKEDATYTVKRGVGYVWTEGLRAGVYRPELENQHGTFFRGPDACVTQRLEKDDMGPFNGGLWIPKDRINKKPRIYYYFGYNKEKAQQMGGLVVSGILAASEGDITFMIDPGPGTFLDNVAVSNLPLN